MKKGILFATMLFAVIAFVGTGFAGGNKICGTLVKIDGAMYTIKDKEKKEHTIHVDPKTTKKTGHLEIGAMVDAEVDSSGHAHWITAAKMDEHKK